MDEQEIRLNELSQGLRPLDEGAAWFATLTSDAQSEVLLRLTEFCVQARAVPDDMSESVRRAGLRTTHTPAVLLGRGWLAKIAGLPQDEWAKAFRLLVSLLGVADERRRARFCVGGCAHAWHRR
jgi:Family of unknown function (DUF5958)